MVSAQTVVVGKQIRRPEGADTAGVALGIDLGAMAAQGAAHADEQKRDRVLIAQAQELIVIPGLTDHEYASLDKMLIAAGHRARTRRLRGAQRGRDTSTAPAVRTEHQQG